MTLLSWCTNPCDVWFIATWPLIRYWQLSWSTDYFPFYSSNLGIAPTTIPIRPGRQQRINMVEMTSDQRLPFSTSWHFLVSPVLILSPRLPHEQVLLPVSQAVQRTAQQPQPDRLKQPSKRLSTFSWSGLLRTTFNHRFCLLLKQNQHHNNLFFFFFHLLVRPSERPSPSAKSSHGVYTAKTPEESRIRRWHQGLWSPCQNRPTTNNFDRKLSNGAQISDSTF